MQRIGRIPLVSSAVVAPTSLMTKQNRDMLLSNNSMRNSSTVSRSAVVISDSKRAIHLAEAVTIAKRTSVILNASLMSRRAPPPSSPSSSSATQQHDAIEGCSDAEAAAKQKEASEAEARFLCQHRFRAVAEWLLTMKHSPESHDTATSGHQVSTAAVSGRVAWTRVLATDASPSMEAERKMNGVNVANDLATDATSSSSVVDADPSAAAPKKKPLLIRYSTQAVSSSSSSSLSSPFVLESLASAFDPSPLSSAASASGEGSASAAAAIVRPMLPQSLMRAASVLQICLEFNTSYTPMTEMRQADGTVKRTPTRNGGGAGNEEKGFVIVMCPLSAGPIEASQRYINEASSAAANAQHHHHQSNPAVEAPIAEAIDSSSSSSPLTPTHPFAYPFLSVGSNVLVSGRFRTSPLLVMKTVAAANGGGSEASEGDAATASSSSSPIRIVPLSFIELSLDGVTSSVRKLPTLMTKSPSK